jgi:hypothetical protein
MYVGNWRGGRLWVMVVDAYPERFRGLNPAPAPFKVIDGVPRSCMNRGRKGQEANMKNCISRACSPNLQKLRMKN